MSAVTIIMIICLNGKLGWLTSFTHCIRAFCQTFISLSLYLHVGESFPAPSHSSVVSPPGFWLPLRFTILLPSLPNFLPSFGNNCQPPAWAGNQGSESALQYIPAWHPSSWRSQLPEPPSWVIFLLRGEKWLSHQFKLDSGAVALLFPLLWYLV